MGENAPLEGRPDSELHDSGREVGEGSPKVFNGNQAGSACDGPLAGVGRACGFLCCLPGIDFLGHVFFSFSALLLVDHSKASEACSPDRVT